MNSISESQEKIRTHTNINKIEVKEKIIIENTKKNRKLFFVKIVVIIFIILLFSIGLIIFFILFNQKIKSDDKKQAESENLIDVEEFKYISKINEKNNSITSIYTFEKGKEVILFNPEKIDLSENNYKIEILSINNSEKNSSYSMRSLEEIKYKYIPNSNGKFEIIISFNILLTSISGLFKNCRNLIEIDLSNLEGSNINDFNLHLKIVKI